MSAVPTDEIYERYLQKAISEINELGDEIGRAGDETHIPVLGSGHPLADVFLLKYTPQPSEVHEGVAFYGRAGQALLKSLQRLRVDPMAVYGTNCLKFGGEDPEEAKPWLTRELHIVQPKLLVLMGERTVEFVNSLAFPLADPIDPAGGRSSASPARSRRSSSRTSTPRSTRRPRRPPSGTRSRPWARGADCRPLSRRAAALMSRSRWAALAGLTAALAPTPPAPAISGTPGFGPTSSSSRSSSSPRRCADRWLALPLAFERGLLPAGLALAVLAVMLRLAELDVLFNLAKLFALIALGFWFLTYFETVAWAVLVAAIIPWVDASPSGAARPSTWSRSSRRSSTTSRSRSASPARRAPRTSGRRTSSSSRSSSPPPPASACASSGRG